MSAFDNLGTDCCNILVQAGNPSTILWCACVSNLSQEIELIQAAYEEVCVNLSPELVVIEQIEEVTKIQNPQVADIWVHGLIEA